MLFRVLATVHPGTDLTRATEAVHAIIAERHDGEDDVTVISQDSVVATLGRIFDAITFMTIAVSERSSEVGLLRALGAPRAEIMGIFLVETALLGALGGLSGIAMRSAAGDAPCGVAKARVLFR